MQRLKMIGECEETYRRKIRICGGNIVNHLGDLVIPLTNKRTKSKAPEYMPFNKLGMKCPVSHVKTRK